MKILLVSHSIENESRFKHSPNCPYSLGLAYLHSVLEHEGHSVKTLFQNNYNFETANYTLFSTINDFEPDIIGFQVFSMNRVSTFRAIEKLTELNPHLRIVLGGVHTSIMYEQIVQKYPNVIAVIGEGELTICELVRAIEDKIKLNGIKGIAYFDNGKVVTTEARSLIEDLDSLPMAKHDIYFENEPKRRMAHIITSRGCPFDCSFCCLKIISKRKLRKRSIASVIEELTYLKNKYPRLRHIQIHDDTFLIDNERVIEFCKKLVEKKLSLTFECSARVKPVSEEMFYWMQKAGFKKIMFGLETGSRKLLQAIHKNIVPDDVIELFNMLKKFNFTITTFLMCGFPGENDETIEDTIKLVNRTQDIYYNWIAGVGKLLVYPGTEVYEMMKAAGDIDDGFWLTDAPVPLYTVEHSLEELCQYEDRLMDSVSVERLFTLRGFLKHFMKYPFKIIAFFVRNPKYLIILLYRALRG